MRKILIAGGLCLASFFIACQQNDPTTKEAKTEKVYEMNEASELAILMREMYEDNLEIRDSIKNGFIPSGFPEAFYKIHTAQASKVKDQKETFDALAKQYIANLEKMAEAESNQEATKLYNGVINTCASCHQIYCQGPLPKIRKMRLPELEL